MSIQAKTKALLAQIDSTRSQLEDLKDDLTDLWREDAFDFQNSIWNLEDALTLIEQAIDLHE